ncbi:MAG: GMC family oxidoreductase N-terminal domain-containing protein, partial [Actinobacteria bacterium]|nr:GMC family oxidoreductase N-terminal domain-containing protein [Actinomycetota bacterium]
MIHAREEITGDLRLSADVVVVGSGAGGATIAKELSGAGHKVVVLEAGRNFTRADFNLRMDFAFVNMYWYGGQVMTMGMPMFLLPQGKTVGGTTTINSGTCFRMPHRVLKKWHLDFGLWEITEEEMDLYYRAVEEYLFVQKGDKEVMGRNALLFLEGAQNLGLSGGILARNAKDCEGYGMCCFGCPSDA